MFDQICEVHRVFMCCGYVDLRKGIDGLSAVVKSHFKLDPYDKGTLFLFCGRRADRAKGLVWQGNGFVLLYRRIEDGRFDWPRTPEAIHELNEEQISLLLRGFDPITPRIREVHPRQIG